VSSSGKRRKRLGRRARQKRRLPTRFRQTRVSSRDIPARPILCNKRPLRMRRKTRKGPKSLQQVNS